LRSLAEEGRRPVDALEDTLLNSGVATTILEHDAVREVEEVAIVKIDDRVIDEQADIVHDSAGRLVETVSSELIHGVSVILNGEEVES